MKYTNTEIVFREVPDKITLAINISGCPNHCPECHSKWLWEDNGTLLDEKELIRLVERNKGINCVAFMGGDAEPEEIVRLGGFLFDMYPSIQQCWYSGRNPEELESLAEAGYLDFLDYIKLGPFKKEYGPLDNKNTNQRMYEISSENSGKKIHFIYKDITHKFWK